MARRSKRLSDTSDGQIFTPSKRTVVHRTMNGLSNRSKASLSFVQDSQLLLKQCFSRLATGTWWRVLPFEGGYDDISAGTGIDWQYLLPLLINTGHVFTMKRKTMNFYQMRNDKWQSSILTDFDDLQFGTYKYNYYKKSNKRTQNIQYFVCRGRPIYKSPTSQLQQIKKSEYERMPIQNAGALRRLVSSHAKKIISQNYEYQMTSSLPPPLPSTPTTRTRSLGGTFASEERREAVAVATAPPTPPTPADEIQLKIKTALALNLYQRPRMNRMNTEEIVLHERSQARTIDRMWVLHTAKLWGWQDESLDSRIRMKIAKAACNQVAYDFGYTKTFAYRNLADWESTAAKMVEDGATLEDVVSPQQIHRGRTSYCDQIESEYPGYIRELFRYAQRTKGGKASFQSLADVMNLRSDSPGEVRPTLHLHYKQLNRWFIQQGGKERSDQSKPLDTPKHKALRMEWIRKWFHTLTNEQLPVVFLDEKWFFTTSRRKKVKILPRADYKDEGVDILPIPKVRTRRHALKVMFMGVVAHPNPTHGFDGRIHLERISQPKEAKRMSHHQQFSYDFDTNHMIKEGDWKGIITKNRLFRIKEHADHIGYNYDLDDAIIDRLVFQYESYHEGEQKYIPVYLVGNDTMQGKQRRVKGSDELVDVEFDYITLKVRTQKGDWLEEDCSCDSEYMKAAMHRVGEALRNTYHWVSPDEPIYLVMDNAGGHGKKHVVQEYTEMLKREYNIEIIFQVPRSPYTNLLDLGVWCSLQSEVKIAHHMKRNDLNLLANTVMNAWENSERLHNVIGRVWQRLGVVLELIREGEGGNDKVESKRGKKYHGLELDEEFLYGNHDEDIINALGELIDIDMDDDDDDAEDDDFVIMDL